MNLKINVPRPWYGINLHFARVFLILIVVNSFSQSLYAQIANYSFSFKNAALDQVIAQVAKKSGYEFIFDATYLQQSKPTTLEIKSASINQVLDAIFKTQNFSYEISGKTIVVKPKVSNEADAKAYPVSGKVIDSTGVGIPGTVVRIKGASGGVQTGADGKFQILVSGGRNTVVFSYIGYKDREFEVTPAISGSNISIVLSPSASLLNEVFVNGFQSITKERNTAAVTIVDNAALNRNLNVDLLSALEGKVAGLVTIKNPTGKSSDRMVLRGIATFASQVGTDPLVVIDGLPTEYTMDEVNPYDIETVTVLKDAAASSIYGARSANGVIVLTTKQGKGSGVKISANADLFITAKPNLSSMHYATTSELIDFETAVYNRELSRYTSVENMFAYYGGINNSTIRYYSPLYQLYRSQSEGTLTASQVNTTLDQWRQNDYKKEYRDHVWQNEVRQRYNLSLSSNSNNINTYVSLNYDQGQGRIVNNTNKAFNLNAKSTFRFKKWLSATIGLNGKYAQDESTDGDYDDINLQPRYARILDANGNRMISDYVNVNDGFSSGGALNGSVLSTIAGNNALKSFGFNILNELNEGINNTKYISLRTFANVEAKLYKGLSFNTQFQYENTNVNTDSYYNANSYKMRFLSNMLTSASGTTFTSNLPSGGRFAQGQSSRSNYTFRNQLNFNQGFGDGNTEHYISAIAGFEMRETWAPRGIAALTYGYDPMTQTGTRLDNQKLSEVGITSYFGGIKSLGDLSLRRVEAKHRFLSMYANAGYTFQGKYSITGSVRVDQADLFGADPKYKNRPLWSAGAAWNVSNEDFLKDATWLNLLKARLTYGINGNADMSSSPYLLSIRRTTDRLYPSLPFLDISTLPNPKLRWEKTATTNIGVDYAILDNRIRGSVDFYNRYSSDLLVTSQLDPTVGTPSIRLNNGAARNRGIEISVGGDWFKNNEWTLSSNVIYGFNKNQVMEVNNSSITAAPYVTAPRDLFYLGSPYNALYAYQYGGITNGYPYFLDENGNSNITFDATGNPTSIRGITNPNALVRAGQLDPKFTGSISQRIRYKDLEISAMFVFSGGNQLRKDVTNLGDNNVMDEDITRRWNANGTSDLPRLLVDYPETLANQASTLSTLWQYSDKQVLDADYIKLRNLAISYQLPKLISNKLKLTSLKVTAQANNLWYWSAAGDDIDPEVYSFNSGTRNFATPKSFLLGLNVTF